MQGRQMQNQMEPWGTSTGSVTWKQGEAVMQEATIA